MIYLSIILIIAFCFAIFLIITDLVKTYKEKHQPFASNTNFSSVDYNKLTYLDFTVKHILYPGEDERFYAVVTVTGHTLKNQKANIILRKNGNDYKFNNEYTDITDIIAWEFTHNYKLTYDKVVEYLNLYYKEKNKNIGKIVHAKDKVNERDCYYYFDTKEEAIEALCMFRKLINKYKNQEINSNNNIIEEDIKVSFDNK